MKVPEIKFDPVEYLMSRRFPGWPERYYPEDRFAGPGMGSSGWGSSSTSGEPPKAEVAAAEAYYAALKGLDPVEVLRRVEAEKKLQTDEKTARAAEIEAGRFYNQDSASADLEHWSKYPYWSLEEAIALSFSRDPKVVYLGSVKEYVGRSVFADAYVARHELVHRELEAGALPERVTPLQFSQWAARKALDLPVEMQEARLQSGSDLKRSRPPRSPQRASAFDRFAEAMTRILDEIRKRADAAGVAFDTAQMPGTKKDLHALALKLEDACDVQYATFDDRLGEAKRCRFKQGSKSSDFYRRLFPELLGAGQSGVGGKKLG